MDLRHVTILQTEIEVRFNVWMVNDIISSDNLFAYGVCIWLMGLGTMNLSLNKNPTGGIKV
jgi:hypothetical protein